jgi:hypothetical protein
MDERLERALEFGNYRRTLSNQKRNIRSRMQILQTVHYKNGVFFANSSTIGFISALITAGKQSAIVVDTKEVPIEIDNLSEFLDILISAYVEATNEYKIQIDKVNKSRNIKKIMDW